MPPSVTLAPWELPPDCNAPLTAPADLVFRSLWQYGFVANPRETEIHLRVVPYKDAFLHYFCDAQRPHNGNWVLGTATYLPYTESIWDFNGFDEFFREYDDLWYEYVSRLLYIEGAPYGSPGTYCITVTPSSGNCHIQYGTRTFEVKDSWRCTSIPSPFKTDRAPARAITTRNQLLAALEDPNSLARYALSDIHLKPHERREQGEEFERTTIAPMRKLLTAVLQSQIDLWQTDQPIHWQTYHCTPKDLALGAKTGWDGNSLDLAVHERPALDIPARLRRWKKAIWDTHITTSREEWLLYSHPSHSHVSVIVYPPTPQQTQEALQLLRDWWHEKFAALYFEPDTNLP